MTEAFIYDAVRSPRGKGRKDGALHEVTAVRLSAEILNAVKTRNNLEGHAVEDVIWGNVTQVAEQGGCLARTAVLASDLDEAIPGLAINRFCASGLEAVNLAANQVRGGAGDGYIAGGVEMMGRVPMGSTAPPSPSILPSPCRAILCRRAFPPISSQPNTALRAMTPTNWRLRARNAPRRPGTTNASRVSRRDQGRQRPFDPRSRRIHAPRHRHADTRRAEPSFQQIGEVMPGFDKIALMKYPHLERINHIHHAGNSSGIVDGAAAVLIGNKAFGEKYGLTPRARIKATAKIGTDPTIMLTGPVPVTEKILPNPAWISKT